MGRPWHEIGASDAQFAQGEVETLPARYDKTNGAVDHLGGVITSPEESRFATDGAGGALLARGLDDGPRLLGLVGRGSRQGGARDGGERGEERDAAASHGAFH